MKIQTLHDLLVHELKDIYSAEKQLLRALPKMAKAASSDALREALEAHLEETQTHVERLEQIMEKLEVSTRGPKCEAMEGLIEEGKKMLEEDIEPSVLDAAIIGSCQRVEHYEIAAYGCARTFANLLGLKDVEKLLQKTLDEEGAADKTLTEIAMEHINAEAVEPALAGEEE